MSLRKIAISGIGSGLVVGSSAAAQYLPSIRVFGLLERLEQYLDNENLQYFLLLTGMWIVAYCVIMWGMVRGRVLSDGTRLSYQGKILAVTLAAFLPFFYVWIVRFESAAIKVATFFEPIGYGLGLVVAFGTLVIVYNILTGIGWFAEPNSGTPSATPPTAPPGGGTP